MICICSELELGNNPARDGEFYGFADVTELLLLKLANETPCDT